MARRRCCEPEWLAEMVCDESHHLPEPWVFAIELEWLDPVDEYDDEPRKGTEPATPEGTWPAIWYAEARGRGVAATRAGQVDIDADDRIVRRHELLPRAGLPKVFHRILRGHPDRKRYPKRGR
ncbi:MAG: hypothetical protein ABR592_02875 [Nitriliruptorales bacterium]